MTGAVAGSYSSLWDDWVDFVDEYGDTGRVRIVSPEIDDEQDTLENIRGALGAAAVSRSPTTCNSSFTHTGW